MRLQHARIIDDAEAHIQQECDIAWQVIEEVKKTYTVLQLKQSF